MFFDTWTGLGRVLVVGILAYGGLILMLRVSGKRTLSKMNAFDLIVTVALGSTLATVLLSREVALAEGLLALGLLIGLQFAITWASVRSARVRGMVKAEPRLLLHHGRYLDRALRLERVTREEIDAAVCAAGRSRTGDVAAVILETDGTFSVVPEARADRDAALDPVVGLTEARRSGV